MRGIIVNLRLLDKITEFLRALYTLLLIGAIGISETIFLTIFKPAFGKSLISGAMLLSRGITFYLYVIISLIVVCIAAVKGKNKKGEIDKKVIKYEKLEKAIS